MEQTQKQNLQNLRLRRQSRIGDKVFKKLIRLEDYLSQYDLGRLKRPAKITAGLLEKYGDGLSLGLSTKLSREAWGTSFFDDVRKDAYDAGIVPGLLTDAAGLGLEAYGFIRGAGGKIPKFSPRIAARATRIPFVGKALSKATEPLMNAGVAAVYGANQASDLNQAAENAGQSAALSLLLDRIAPPVGEAVRKGLGKAAENPYLRSWFAKFGAQADDYVQNATRDLYGRLEKILGAQKLDRALERAKQLKRSLIEVLDGKDVRRILSDLQADRATMGAKRKEVRTQNAYRAQNIVGRSMGKAGSIKDDDALLKYYRDQAMDYYKALKNQGDLEKYELAGAFERLASEVKPKLGIKRPEEYFDILLGQSAQLKRPLLKDLEHFTKDPERREFVDTMTRTYRAPDVSAIAYKDGLPRRVLMKKYNKDDVGFYDLIIEHDNGFYTKFPKKKARGAAEQFEEPFYDLYVKDKSLIKGYRPLKEAIHGNPSAKTSLAKDIGMGPSKVRDYSIAQNANLVNPLRAEIENKNLIKGYRPVKEAAIGNPSAKANLSKDIGMGPSEVRDYSMAQTRSDVKGYVDGLDTYLKSLGTGPSALLRDAKGRPGRVPFMSHVGRITHYDPVVSGAVRQAKQMPSLAALPDADAAVLLQARDILSGQGIKDQSAKKAVRDLDFAIKEAYPDYGLWLKNTPDKDIYNKAVSNPRFDPLNDMVAPKAFKTEVTRIAPPARTKILQNTQNKMMTDPSGRLTYRNVFKPSFGRKMAALTQDWIIDDLVKEAKIGANAIANLNFAAKRPIPLHGFSRLRKSAASMFGGYQGKAKQAAEFLTNPIRRLNPSDLRAPWELDLKPYLNRFLTVPVVKGIGSLQDEDS